MVFGWGKKKPAETSTEIPVEHESNNPNISLTDVPKIIDGFK